MSRTLEELKKENAIYAAAAAFYRKHREIWACEANTAVIAEAVEKAEQPQTLESWEKIAPSVRLAVKPVEREVEEVAPEPSYPKPPAGLDKFGPIPDINTARRVIPGDIWKSYLFDKVADRTSSTGYRPSKKSLEFQQWIEDLQRPRGEN